MFNAENASQKWQPILENAAIPEIKDNYRKSVTAVLLENQEKAMREERAAFGMVNETAANATGAGIDTFDPVLISLVRRAMPNLMAYDVAGVQPMSGPTGLIFAMKSRYKTTKAGAVATANSGAGTEALFDEALVNYSGDSSTSSGGSEGPSGLAGISDTDTDSSIVDSGSSYVPTTGDAYTTAEAEALGNTGESFAEMGFTIEKATVTAKSRALKA